MEAALEQAALAADSPYTFERSFYAAGTVYALTPPPTCAEPSRHTSSSMAPSLPRPSCSKAPLLPVTRALLGFPQADLFLRHDGPSFIQADLAAT